MHLIEHEIRGGVGHLTLQRPKAINALNVEMLTAITTVLDDWFGQEQVRGVELHGAGDKGFCAGADVRELRALMLDGKPWIQFLELEYSVDLLLAEAPVPVTSHQYGITMGGGLGLTAHTSRRLVDTTSRFAMPETKIGLFPDCAVLHQLSRAGAPGVHVSLTSDTFGGGDAIALGLADESTDGELDAPLHSPEAAWMQECYVGDDAVAIVERLEAHGHPDAARAAESIRARSPLAVHVALRALRRAETKTLREVFTQDLVLAERMLEVDFPEGVRALLVDKDQQPRWRWARLEDVPADVVDAIFED